MIKYLHVSKSPFIFAVPSIMRATLRTAADGIEKGKKSMITKHYCNGKEVASYDGDKSLDVIVSEIRTVKTLIIDSITSNEVKYHDNEGNTFAVVVNNK